MKNIIFLLSLVSALNVPASTVHASAETCIYDAPEESVYEAELVDEIEISLDRENSIYTTIIRLENTGTETWFGFRSGCNEHPYFNLGTENQKDRSSVFYMPSLQHLAGWIAPNRIIMQEQRVEPGEVATFEFKSYEPYTDDIYREYYQPVLEGHMWLEDVLPPVDYYVGEYSDEMLDRVQYMNNSGKVSTLLLDELKWLEVDLSEQEMYLWIGDILVETFQVSSGAPSTPTPVGTTTITHKQEVRVGMSWPHYIMPNWMTYRGGGYGFHALPSLANDGGVFWSEALDHIGRPVSHGCIRLLPHDAEYLYNFTPVGATVNIHY